MGDRTVSVRAPATTKPPAVAERISAAIISVATRALSCTRVRWSWVA
jgi:hypothetical protein